MFGFPNLEFKMPDAFFHAQEPALIAEGGLLIYFSYNTFLCVCVLNIYLLNLKLRVKEREKQKNIFHHRFILQMTTMARAGHSKVGVRNPYWIFNVGIGIRVSEPFCAVFPSY